jgi:hypothetical protein
LVDFSSVLAGFLSPAFVASSAFLVGGEVSPNPRHLLGFQQIRAIESVRGDTARSLSLRERLR